MESRVNGSQEALDCSTDRVDGDDLPLVSEEVRHDLGDLRFPDRAVNPLGGPLGR